MKFCCTILIALALLVSGCSSSLPSLPSFPSHAPNATLKAGDITIHLPYAERTSSVEKFFQSRVVMVGHFKAAPADDGEYWMDYPSINSGESPLYSHRVSIVVDGKFPLTIEEVIKRKYRGVFVWAGSEHAWRLVGYVTDRKTKCAL